jgi:hypothetical protein
MRPAAVVQQPQENSLPTEPSSVVWSRGHAFVFEGLIARWVGIDDRGRPRALSSADLCRRGWSRTRCA